MSEVVLNLPLTEAEAIDLCARVAASPAPLKRLRLACAHLKIRKGERYCWLKLKPIDVRFLVRIFEDDEAWQAKLTYTAHLYGAPA